MTLNEIRDGERAVIENFEIDDNLRQRFFSFGLNPGKKIKKLKSTLKGSTIEIQIDRSCVILRKNEAAKIRVSRANENA